MDVNTSRRVLESPHFHELERAKNRTGWILSFVMLFIYFGFLLIVSVNPSYLHQSLSGGVTTVGIPLGIFVILSAIILAGAYTWYANSKFDALTAKVVEEATK